MSAPVLTGLSLGVWAGVRVTGGGVDLRQALSSSTEGGGDLRDDEDFFRPNLGDRNGDFGGFNLLFLSGVKQEVTLTKYRDIFKTLVKDYKAFPFCYGTLLGSNFFVFVCLNQAANIFLIFSYIFR